MSLSSAKAKLDAQGGDPVTGYISKTDHQESYDELVDDTALTGTTTAEAVTVSGALVAGTVNGRDPDDLVAGPASATDNALVRFDGTTGKTVQDSGITVNDSGYITSDFVVSKASPVLSVSASTTTTSSIYIDCAAAGSYGRFLFRVNGSRRWDFGRDGTAEAGANAGSDFYIASYNDASAAISTPFKITRATGKTTLGSVGASAGLELGSSGPRVMSGTGSPESVVTAPVGSTWIDTAATTGAIKWVKATGTGNTGWVVEYGDTGRRAVASAVQTNYAVASSVNYLSRIGATVFYQGIIQKTTGNYAANDIPFILPAGFRPQSSFYQYAAGLNTGVQTNINIPSATGEVTLAANTAAAYLYLNFTFRTADAWPSSLPGSAA